jgi:anti-sigma B factor antagonist
VRAVIPAGDERTSDGGEAVVKYPAREQLMSWRREDRADAVIITVEGSVDGLTAPRLRAAIAAAFDRLGDRPLIVDLTAVRFFGSAGLRTLSESAEQAAGEPGFQPLRIVVDHNRPVVRPLEITGLNTILALYYDVAGAITASNPE